MRNSIYSLLSNASAININPNTRGIACEGQTLNLQCPEGQNLNILSANFGRTDSTMCGISSKTNCLSDKTLDLQIYCNNNNNCTVNANFADPCSGTPKYLGINFF